MWKSGSVLVVMVVVWSEGHFRPSRRIVLQEIDRVTNTVFLGLFAVSVSESEDVDEDEDDDELARRAFLVADLLAGVWLGLFLPSWSLSEKRSVLLSSSEMASVKMKK